MKTGNKRLMLKEISNVGIYYTLAISNCQFSFIVCMKRFMTMLTGF